MKKIDWKDLWISMIVYLVFFIAIAIGMVVSNTWELTSKPMILFLGIGFPISILIIIVKQNLSDKWEK